jgi:hypothetical protein
VAWSNQLWRWRFSSSVSMVRSIQLVKLGTLA